MKLKKEDAKTCLKSNWLTVATFTGVILGLVIGIVIKQSDPEKWNHPDCSKREAMYIGFIGRLFLSALKSIIIPLIVPSLIIAVGTLDLSLSGKIGGRAIAYYMTTTLVSRKILQFTNPINHNLPCPGTKILALLLMCHDSRLVFRLPLSLESFW